MLPAPDEPGLPPLPERSHRFVGWRGLLELPVFVLVVILLALAVRVWVAQPFVIPSGSMIPQLLIGDRVLVSRMAYDFHDINRGDVLVFESLEEVPPDESILPWRAVKRTLETFGIRKPRNEDLIKRVIGLPGEVVEGRGGRVFIDGKELYEPYLPAAAITATFEPMLIPDGHVWMMGDNRPNSSDSRSFGPVPMERIVGRAFLRVWPPGRWAFL